MSVCLSKKYRDTQLVILCIMGKWVFNYCTRTLIYGRKLFPRNIYTNFV